MSTEKLEKSSPSPLPAKDEIQITKQENAPGSKVDADLGAIDLDHRALAAAASNEHAASASDAIRTHFSAFMWCIFICMGALLWGYDAQVGGGLLSVPSFRRDFGSIYEGQPVLAARWQSAFNSVSSVGGIFGGLSLGAVSDRLGRRGAVALASVISLGAVLIQFFAPAHNNGMLLAGKLINGYSLGMFVSVAGSYCAEVSPLALRGITTASVNLWIDLGQLMSNGIIRGVGERTDAYAYRIPFALQWIFPVILLLGLSFAPESPWFLVRRNRNADALKVIERLSSGSDADAQLQLQQIEETIALEDHFAATSTYGDMFRGSDGRRTLIAVSVFVLQQMAGVTFVLGYSTYFFELAGFDDSNAFDLGVGVTAIGIVGNSITFYTVNRFGRRFIFKWGMIACTTVLLLIGFLTISSSQAAKWATAAFTLIYNFIYQTSIGPLGYVIFAEVSSAKLRSKTVGLSICVNSLCALVANIVMSYLVNPDEANLGGYVGFIFGGLSVFGSIWVWFYIPETKNRTVDELDVMFEKRLPARAFESYTIYEEKA
ncbi:maltose permease [Coniophora puteana RWD-64-598 SS2]|uniref:Maltose permease n=1 Tax=Coniophora puteana (strain RWD-64-598) TaxID=741705 RepID=A0A5M3MF26_CONPW|nr:maltose permease [Coniophora puteana RWD-64-598 SS2]EIW77181.1 maltose permease [Coniophora puteana RWD-64-598 SS2]